MVWLKLRCVPVQEIDSTSMSHVIYYNHQRKVRLAIDMENDTLYIGLANIMKKNA